MGCSVRLRFLASCRRNRQSRAGRCARAGIRRRHRAAVIDIVVLGGEAVVGVGNIYASEALFMAGIRPTTKAHRISKPRATLLHHAIQQVLTQAVIKGGSTLRDFSNAQGEAGHFQLDAMVYNRAGLPCKVCATPIKSIRQGQRSTFYCVSCQKR